MQKKALIVTTKFTNVKAIILYICAFWSYFFSLYTLSAPNELIMSCGIILSDRMNFCCNFNKCRRMTIIFTMF